MDLKRLSSSSNLLVCSYNTAMLHDRAPKRHFVQTWNDHTHLNLLTMTATIRRTSTVMMAIVTILLVAILRSSVSTTYSRCIDHHRFGTHLLAMPLNVLLLLSV